MRTRYGGGVRKVVRQHAARSITGWTKPAGPVCEADPRTKVQRRADAPAPVAGADQLTCTCGQPDCTTANGRLRDPNVVIYVVAEQETIEGKGATPGFMAGQTP